MVIRSLVPLLIAGAAAGAAADPATPAEPWTETIRMELREEARTFVVHGGTAWLALVMGDLEDIAFLHGKDVMLAAKYERGDGGRAWFYGWEALPVRGRAELWSTRIEGDNLYVFGRVQPGEQGLELLASDVVVGESDAQIVARRLQDLAPDDHAGRLAAARAVREQGASQGNHDWWSAAADTIVAQVVERVAAQAAERKNPALLGQAVDWALDEARDPVLAARAASQPWLFDAGGPEAEAIAQRLRALRFDYYKGRWRTRLESLQTQFDDRFATITWRDAEAYYKLGRWAEANADDMPRARELAYRCYQAGLRGDAAHAGIRRVLGLEPLDAKRGAARQQDGAYVHPGGAAIDGPDGWKRGDAIDGEATWNDPASETAYVSVSLLTGETVPPEFAAAQTAALSAFVARSGYQMLDEQPVAFPAGEARRIRFGYREGRFARMGEVIVAHTATPRLLVVINSTFVPEEQEQISAALQATLAKLVLPAAPAAGAAAEGAPPAPASVPTP